LRRRFARNVPGPGAVAGAIEFAELFRLLPRELSSEQIEATIRGVSGLPESYLHFLCAWSFKRLELEPWIEFPPNSVGGLKLLRRLQSQLPSAECIPFATELSNGGVFFFDCRRREGGEPSIGLWLSDYEVEPGRVEQNVTLCPLATSFAHLMLALTEVVNSPTVLWVPAGQTATPDQLDLVRRIRSVDPEGLGSVGWKLWWGWHVVNFPTEGYR
jgi:hypothetical protein